MGFIKFSVSRRVTISMMYALVFLLGAIAWNRLPQEYMPNLEFPQLVVLTSYENASSQEVENLITKVVEEACGTVKGVRRIHSVSKEGISIVTVEFVWGVDMDFASLNLREKIDLAKVKLPREAGEPRIEKFNPFALPVVVLSLTGDRPPQDLLKIAKRPVSELLEKVQGVAAVSITGGLEREILVELDQSKLANRKVPILNVVDSISHANITYPAGTVEDNTYEYVVRVEGAFEKPHDVENVVVKVDREETFPSAMQSREKDSRKRRQDDRSKSSPLLFLSSLGKVKDTFKERSSYSRYDGRENISLAILKQGEANIVNVADAVKKKLNDIKNKLPKGINIEVVYDQSIFIKDGIKQMLVAGLEGGILAFLVLFLFLGNYRQALVVSTAIPTSIFATLFLVYMKGLTINTVSLAGLAVGIGMLVDGAIVVIENITRNRSMGKETGESAVTGASEVFGAVASSVGTTIVVFLPLVFVPGIIGQVFNDLSWSVVFSQIASLVVAFTLIPMLAGLIRHTKTDSFKWQKPLAQKSRIIIEKYNKLLDWSLSYPLKALLYTAGIFCFSVLLLVFIPKALFPKVDQGQFLLKLSMPIGTKLEVTNKAAERIENELVQIPEIFHRTTTVGSVSQEGLQPLGEHEAQIVVDLKEKRKKTTDEIIQEVKKRLEKQDLIGGKVVYSQEGGQFSAFAGGGSPVVIEVKGYDIETLNKISETLKSGLNSIKGIYNIDSSLNLNSMEIGIEVNRDVLASYSLSVTDLAKTVLTAVRGTVASKYREEGKEIDIRVRLKEEDTKDQKALHSLLINSPLRVDIPLESIAKVEQKLGPSEILHYDQQRTVLVTAGLFKKSLDSVKPDIDKLLDEMRGKYPDFSFDLTGEATQLAESFSSLKIILLLSILLVYMIMAAQFESFWQPLLILITIPLSVIGMGPALLVTGHELSAMTGMGLVLLCGIVVNNGIVLIDFINQNRNQGMGLKEALKEGCNVRMRPILMTASTTILGLIPLALGIGEGTQMQSPMAVVVVSGLFVSTVLTLVVLPTLYLLVEEKIINVWINRKKLDKINTSIK